MSDTLKRYEPSSPGMIQCSSGGGWVKHADHLAEIERLEAENKSLRGALEMYHKFNRIHNDHEAELYDAGEAALHPTGLKGESQ